MLDLSTLKKAISQLEKSYSFCHSDLSQDIELFMQFRAATIQAFEYTFELCIKMLRRQLEIMADIPQQIDELGYKDLIRTGCEKDLLENPLAWFNFRENRNITAHTYNEEKAELVYSIIPNFIARSHYLLSKLMAQNK